MDRGRLKHLKIDSKSLEILYLEGLEKLDLAEDSVNWLHISSLADRTLIESLTQSLGISPLVIEDILDLGQLPKVEDYGDYIFIILEDIGLNKEGRLYSKQLSLILFEKLIISIDEDESQTFEDLYRQIEARIGSAESSADRIFFQLVDKCVEGYFDLLEKLGERIDEVEDRLLIEPEKETLSDIYKLKRDLIGLRKTLWLMRSATSRLIKGGYNQIGEKSLGYFEETYDDMLQLIDLTETYRDICSGMLDIYLSSISNRTNDIMKVLTILSTIFIPLTFMAGIYGMNFKHFPEIGWKYGYLGFWVLSAIITAFMIRFFKKKGWI
ncbi:MAG: magnesium/cobalt transporter CorA [Tissierellia bacterium]|nr:magnesium/cobalt transporter CorA [Tissierellia bacterium]